MPHPTNGLLIVPLVNFLEKKEAHFLDKQKQGMIYIEGECPPTNHLTIVPLVIVFGRKKRGTFFR